MEKQDRFEFRDSNCEKHGAYLEKGIKFNGRVIWPGCLTCNDEKLSAEDASKETEESRKKSAKALHYLKTNGEMPPRMVGKGLESFIGGTPGKDLVKRKAASFVENAKGSCAAGVSLIMCGGVGTGKTHLACAIAHECALRYGLKSMYRTTYDLVLEIKESWGRGLERTESQVYRDFLEPDILILDEVGVQFGSDSESIIIFHVINKRYNAMKSTIVISNLNIDGVKEYLGERVVDRLREGGGQQLPFDWDSARK